MAENPTIRRALISVTDKSGVAEFARALEDEFGVEVISTGGTARALEDAGVTVRAIDDFTGFPEMMDGRVKTLHPKVHGALLARRDSEQHMAEVAEHGIEPFEIAARGAGEVKNVAENGYQIVLLGPQISYLKDRVKAKCEGVPLEVIPMKDYGRQNCPAIFELINRVIG